MKSSRAHLVLAGGVFLSLSLALLLALGGYFHSVERHGPGTSSSKRLQSHLKIFHDQLQLAETPEQAKAAVKLLESISGLGQESEGARELKKAYAPVLAVFAAKPREAESRYQLTKKRELMENLVNSYRKEIPHGDIRVRAAYLNVLFDVQASLLSDSDEAEQVFLKRNRERVDGLKILVGNGRDAGLTSRVATIDSLLQSYERGFQQAVKWRSEKADALARQEKSIPAVAKEIFANEDSGVDDTRRTFLYICFVCLVIFGAGFLALFLGFKVLRIRAELKWDSFLMYLRVFGSERSDPQVQTAIAELREDSDWAQMLAEAQKSEESFLRASQNQLAVPRSLRSPFLVVGKDKAIRHWNEASAALFGLVESREWGLGDILTADHIGVKDGDANAALDIIRSSFSALTEDRFEILLKKGGEWLPYELSMSPITGGPLAGGKILLLREIRSESERVDKAVAAQLHRIHEILHKVTHQLPVELAPEPADGHSVRQMLNDLSTLQGRNEEREHHWKSEAQALLDQVSRQQDVLHKLTEELERVRSSQREALDLVREVHGGDEHMHDEVCVMERDLERWSMSRKRLSGDVKQLSAVLDRARKFEEQLREATETARQELSNYEEELQELEQFSEAARVHSVNLSLVRDPGYWEYASRTRAFAHELQRFTAKAAELGEKMQKFLAAHPGGALAAHLNAPPLDEAALSAISEEQERIASHLKRWKENSQLNIQGGEKAVAKLQNAEKTGAVASQLGETSLLINTQARSNLERWN